VIPDEIIEQVREAADVVGIIGEHVELRRTGADYRGPCPFHGGTHRNFAVIPKKGMFYCFVCHEAGDVYTFFMKKLGMDYPTAVREVARRVGITIPSAPVPPVPIRASRCTPPSRPRPIGSRASYARVPRPRSPANTSSRATSRWSRRRCKAWATPRAGRRCSMR